MKIIVLVKQVPDTYGQRSLDTVTGRVDRRSVDLVIDEIDERALEVALKLKDADKSITVVVFTMGPASATAALRKGLSMGADSAVHVLDDQLAGSDAMWTSRVLAAALTATGFDLIVAGNESTDGRGGVVPAAIAEHLGIPCLGFVNAIGLSGSTVSGDRATDFGTLQVQADLPALVSITESGPEPRFPDFKGIMTAKRKPLTVLSLAEIGVGAAELTAVGATAVLRTDERPARSSGTRVIDSGNAGNEIAEFLVANRLI